MNEGAGSELSDTAEDMLMSVTTRREKVEAAIAWMHGQIERLTSLEVDHLPPAGTTISEALLTEAERLGTHNVALPSGMAAGFSVGQAAILRGLRARAAAVRARGEDERRPPTAPIADPAGGPPVPSQPTKESLQSFFRHYAPIWEFSNLPRSEQTTVFRAIDQLCDLEWRKSDLQVAFSRTVERLDPADVRWRNALAGELRAQADELGTRSDIGDSFTQGFSLATQVLTGRLRKRAEEIAVPGPS